MTDLFAKLGVTKNGRERPQFSKGLLYKQTLDGIVTASFKYELLKNIYTEVPSIVGGVDFIKPQKTIYTSETWRGFAVGDKVKLENSNGDMTIQSVEVDSDPHAPQNTKGYIITLE